MGAYGAGDEGEAAGLRALVGQLPLDHHEASVHLPVLEDVVPAKTLTADS